MMSNIARLLTIITISLGLIGCAVYAAPVAYAPRPYYGYHGGWH